MTVHISKQLSEKLLSSVEIPSSLSPVSVAAPLFGMTVDPVFHQAKIWFDKITYRPDTTLEFHQYSDVHMRAMYAGTVVFYRMVENSYRPNEFMRLQFNNLVPSYVCKNELTFYHFIGQCLEQFEIHEAQEWFKIEGQVWQDPHNQGVGYKHDGQTRNPNDSQVGG